MKQFSTNRFQCCFASVQQEIIMMVDVKMWHMGGLLDECVVDVQKRLWRHLYVCS